MFCESVGSKAVTGEKNSRTHFSLAMIVSVHCLLKWAHFYEQGFFLLLLKIFLECIRGFLTVKP